MILYKTRRKIKRWLRDNFRFYKTFILTQFTKESQKKVFLEIEEIALNRYLYNFIKFFTLNDYTVYIPKNKKVISTLNRKKGEFIYGSWILKEQVKLGKPKNPDLVISKKQLSNDYFRKRIKNSYYVPMSEYPGIYFNDIYQEFRVLDATRKRSVFMAGNFDSEPYNQISNAGFFNIYSRAEVRDYIKDQAYYLDINNIMELRNFRNTRIDHKVILVDTSSQFRIPLVELKKILQGFHFFLALPGILIPQSHNLIEAMSVGCIPIIHKTYAGLLHPYLKHMETAIIYESLEDLNDVILTSFMFPKALLDSLHDNVLKYYNSYLSPSSVVRKIESGDFTKIFIQAEHISLQLLETGEYNCRN